MSVTYYIQEEVDGPGYHVTYTQYEEKLYLIASLKKRIHELEKENSELRERLHEARYREWQDV